MRMGAAFGSEFIRVSHDANVSMSSFVCACCAEITSNDVDDDNDGIVGDDEHLDDNDDDQVDSKLYLLFVGSDMQRLHLIMLLMMSVDDDD